MKAVRAGHKGAITKLLKKFEEIQQSSEADYEEISTLLEVVTQKKTSTRRSWSKLQMKILQWQYRTQMRITIITKMSIEQQSGYVNNIVDIGLTDMGDTVEYDECIGNIDKSGYDQLSPNRYDLDHDNMVLSSSFKAETKQSDNEVHQKKKSLLRPIFIMMCCIMISSGVTAAATFFATKQLYSENKEKYTDATQCNMSSDNGYNRTIDSPESCTTEPCENGGTCNNYTCLCEDGFAGSNCEIDVNQTCKSEVYSLIPHPNTCQLFYNCSQAVSPLPTEDRLTPHMPQTLRPAYQHECPFPELFSTTTLSCQNYTDVKCGSRYETKNKCDYLAISYICRGACKPCIYFTPDCIRFSDGIYRNKYIAPPGEAYFECQDERIIYSGGNPCQTNMAPHNGKCKDKFEIPTSYWQVGYGVDCSSRPNGNYKSERIQRCDIYYTCVNGNSTLAQCGNGTVFDSKSLFCQDPANACRPCGSFDNGC